MVEFACRCAKAVKEKGWKIFGLQDYGMFNWTGMKFWREIRTKMVIKCPAFKEAKKGSQNPT